MTRRDDDEYARQIAAATKFLEEIAEAYDQLATLPEDSRRQFLMAAGRVARPGPWDRHALATAASDRRKARHRKRDEERLEQTGIRQVRRRPVFAPWVHGGMIESGGETRRNEPDDVETPADGSRLDASIPCYICKTQFKQLHFFYDALCPDCADLNWAKRTPNADLAGRVALITGARVKIGYQAALMLLRAGTRVVVSTRFPRDAAKRYESEKDFSSWSDRLEIFGLDLRHTPAVESFTRFLRDHLPRLDFIINNACQTVRRPPGFYQHLMDGETEPIEQLPVHARALLPATLSQIALLEEDHDRGSHLFPAGQLDADLQQVDLREVNSWRLGLSDVSAVELLEVQLVNSVAPFILNARLKPLMRKTDNRDKHIVNVSAVEGQFSRRHKTDRHPHTNMAKAALNMMTRTSAADYLRDGIHMNSVDTGWVTDEDPAVIAERKKREQGFHPPLDIIDGAARIVDPIFDGITTGVHTWGAFLKDYRVVDW
ncbi:MAG: SDR family oxidoreductase [Acidobacteriota bacterium]|nr:SDR family oxidoreductase [Acidobacteriota bacterium]MDH3784979.1 SDR family oxidoreductase [Acidobacteriota bacterium]